MDEETKWNVLMRLARREWGLVSWGYGVEATQEIISEQVTATSLNAWDVCEEVA